MRRGLHADLATAGGGALQIFLVGSREWFAGSSSIRRQSGQCVCHCGSVPDACWAMLASAVASCSEGGGFLDVFLSLWLPRCRDRESCVDLNCLNWSRSAWKLPAVDDVALPVVVSC